MPQLYHIPTANTYPVEYLSQQQLALFQWTLKDIGSVRGVDKGALKRLRKLMAKE